MCESSHLAITLEKEKDAGTWNLRFTPGHSSILPTHPIKRLLDEPWGLGWTVGP